MSKPVIISATAILAIAIVTVLLWPDAQGQLEQDTGIAGFSIPVVVQQTSTPTSANKTAPERDAGKETRALRSTPETIRNPRRDMEARSEEWDRHLREIGAKLSADIANAPLFDGTPLRPVPDGAATLPNGSETLTLRQMDEIGKILGNSYDRRLAFDLARMTRTSVIRFQDVFGPDANPLSDEQTESVVAALVAEQMLINRDMTTIPRPFATDAQSRLQIELERTLRYSPENNRRLVEAASRSLNAGQLVDYREMLEADSNKSIESLRAQIVQLENPRLIPATP